jgi:hypothetical protein
METSSDSLTSALIFIDDSSKLSYLIDQSSPPTSEFQVNVKCNASRTIHVVHIFILFECMLTLYFSSFSHSGRNCRSAPRQLLVAEERYFEPTLALYLNDFHGIYVWSPVHNH